MKSISQLRSDVMKAARIIWNNDKTLSWSAAMAKSWADMKNNRTVIAKQIDGGKSVCRVSTKIWEKDGKVRMYINLVFADGTKIDLGFADMVAKKCFFADKGYQAIWAARMTRNIVFA